MTVLASDARNKGTLRGQAAILVPLAIISHLGVSKPMLQNYFISEIEIYVDLNFTSHRNSVERSYALYTPSQIEGQSERNRRFQNFTERRLLIAWLKYLHGLKSTS
jgi:hypothetical protein